MRDFGKDELNFARAILRKAQEQEPVCDKDPQGCWNVRCQLGKKCKNTPTQRTWVGLTLTQVKLLWEGVQEEAIKSGDSYNWVFYKHINEALKEKNK